MTGIVIVRAEGRICDAVQPGYVYRFTSWQDARNHLQGLCEGINPERLGYDKCDFSVSFADGFVYSGRYDAAHPKSKCHETPDLGLQIEQHLSFVARIERPEWISPTYWQQLTNDQPETEREQARQLLAGYALRD